MSSGGGGAHKFNPLNGFTLAEVLITLGIIGVVAALTMPTLINKSEEKVLESQYSKSKSEIANGYKLMMAKQELFETEHLPFLKCENQSCLSSEHKKTFNIVSDSTGGIKTDKLPNSYAIEGKPKSSPHDWSKADYIYVLTDGSVNGLFISADKKHLT